MYNTEKQSFKPEIALATAQNILLTIVILTTVLSGHISSEDSAETLVVLMIPIFLMAYPIVIANIPIGYSFLKRRGPGLPKNFRYYLYLSWVVSILALLYWITSIVTALIWG